MIGGTYTISAVLLALTGYLFAAGRADARPPRPCSGRSSSSSPRRRELGLPDGQRDLPGRAPRHGHRAVLRRRHADRRDAGPVALRPPGRHGLAARPVLRRPLGLGPAAGTVVVVAVFGVKAERSSLEEIAEPSRPPCKRTFPAHRDLPLSTTGGNALGGRAGNCSTRSCHEAWWDVIIRESA